MLTLIAGGAEPEHCPSPQQDTQSRRRLGQQPRVAVHDAVDHHDKFDRLGLSELRSLRGVNGYTRETWGVYGRTSTATGVIATIRLLVKFLHGSRGKR